MKFSKNKHILENVDDTQAQLFFKRHLGTPECNNLQVFFKEKAKPHRINTSTWHLSIYSLILAS